MHIHRGQAFVLCGYDPHSVAGLFKSLLGIQRKGLGKDPRQGRTYEQLTGTPQKGQTGARFIDKSVWAELAPGLLRCANTSNRASPRYSAMVGKVTHLVGVAECFSKHAAVVVPAG